MRTNPIILAELAALFLKPKKQLLSPIEYPIAAMAGLRYKQHRGGDWRSPTKKIKEETKAHRIMAAKSRRINHLRGQK